MNDAWQRFVMGLADAARSPELALSIAFTIAVLIVFYWVLAARIARTTPKERTGRASHGSLDLAELRSRLDALEAAATRNLQHVGFVRFNAFADVGSELSYALAVVDGNGNGFVLSSIYSREEVRTYAKAVRGFTADKEMSAEELRAIELARQPGRGVG